MALRSGDVDIDVDNVIEVTNSDVWRDADERRRNTDAPIDDPNIASVDRSENVDESIDRISIWLTQISLNVSLITNGLFYILLV